MCLAKSVRVPVAASVKACIPAKDLLTIIKGMSSASLVQWRRKQIAPYRKANQGYYQHQEKDQHKAFESQIGPIGASSWCSHIRLISIWVCNQK